jgi:hypothetical protein
VDKVAILQMIENYRQRCYDEIQSECPASVGYDQAEKMLAQVHLMVYYYLVDKQKGVYDEAA